MAGNTAQSNNAMDQATSSERTPLLSRSAVDEVPSYSERTTGEPSSPAARSLQSLQDGQDGKGKGGQRWATIIALSTLCAIVIVILGLGFAGPAAVEEYAKEAVQFEPTKLSIDSFETTGIRARVKGVFMLDASKVHNKAIWDLGKAGTYIAKEIETSESELKVYLPEYDNLLLGTATVPKIKVNIRNMHENHIDIVTDLEPGHLEGIRKLANDWLDGRLGKLEVKGIATVDIRSGIFKFGSQTISQSLVFEGQSLPAFPEFEISKLNFYEIRRDPGETMLAAEASVLIANDYPVRLNVPPLGFDILVPNCLPKQEYLLLANASTLDLEINPKEVVNVSVLATVRQLPSALTNACPGSNSSPLDLLLASYIRGEDTTVFVRGSDSPSDETPSWISDLAKSVIVPLPFPGRTLDNLIRNFSMADVHFDLPNPLAEPGDPDSMPMVSAVVNALVGLPKEMNFQVDVNRVRANADVFYQKKKLGELDLHRWQAANTSRVEDKEDGPALLVQAKVEKAPLKITDEDVFTEVVQALMFKSKRVVLDISAKVDVDTITALGDFIVRDIPASGKVFVKPLRGGGGLAGFQPSIGDLGILDTTRDTLTLKANVNMTNPTEYSARVPYVSINILSNGTVLGHAIVRNVTIISGNNTNITIEATWDPIHASGKHGGQVGRDLLSQYVSGFNTTLTLKTHEKSIPSHPALGKALAALELTVDTPRLHTPRVPRDGDGDDNEDDEDSGPHFIQDATMHLITSTASFTLLSPLPKTTLYITSISAVAFYNHTDCVGTIDYDLPFDVPPGLSMTPRLPVDWSLDSAGYDAVRDALGGTLKLDTRADAGIRVDNWEEQIWFVGRGIGAHIRL